MSESRKTVLLVGSDDRHRETLRQWVGDRHLLLEAHTGDNALAQLQKAPVDCVLLNWRLPDCTGLEMLPRMSQPAPAVVMLTAHNNEEVSAQAFELGCQDCIVPTDLDRERVLGIIARAIGRKRREESLERERNELEAFMGKAAHDLRAPLRHIHSYATLVDRALDSSDADRARGYLSKVRGAAEQLSGLVDALLGYTRLDAIPVHAGDVPLNAVIDSLLGELSAPLSTSGGHIERGSLPVVWGDTRLLSQLFLNLLENAIKFRGEQPPQVRIDAELADAEWCVRVRDNGIGIPEQFRQEVFKPLRRLNPVGTYEGHGLGLYASQRVVQKHGGSLRIEAPLDGPGTVVCVRLPNAGRGY